MLPPIFKMMLLLAALFSVTNANAFDGPVRPSLTLGSGALFERGNDGTTQISRLPISIGAGAQLDRWKTRFEYSSFRTTDGNATVSTRRSFETVLAWGAYEFGMGSEWTPYASVGVGMARSSAETRLAQSFETTNGTWTGMFAVGFGFRGEWTRNFHVRPELRYESAEAFKTKDARMGAFIQLDFVR